MKTKIFSVLLTVALMVSLCLVAVGPVGAQIAGTISLDSDWYTTPDTVTVTVNDADWKVLTEELDEELGVGDGSKKYFAVDNPPIADITGDGILDAADVKVYSDGTRVSSSIIESVTTSGITLGIPPGGVATILPETDVGDGTTPTELMPSVTQPPEEMTLSLTAGADIVEGNVVITGTVGGETGISDTIHLTPSTTVRSAKAFTAISAIDAGALMHSEPLTTTDTLAIEGINILTIDYWHGTVDTVGITATSTGDLESITVTLTETGPGTGIFKGTFDLGGTHTGSQLIANDGDTITATYTDEDPADVVSATANVETTAPTISELTPADGAYTNNPKPTISAVLADTESGIDEETISMTVEGSDVTDLAEYNSATGLLSYTPTSDLSDGSVAVVVNVDDIAGNSADAASWSFTVDTVEPTAPTNLAATAMPKRIDLTWTVATDTNPINHYNIYRSISEGVEVVTANKIGESTTTSYSDSAGVHGVTYYYAVTAVDVATNEGDASSEVSDTFSGEYATQTFGSDLIGGWNYISLPVIPINSDTTVVLESVADKYSEVWAYEGQEWQVYIPGEPDEYYVLTSLTKLEDMVDGLGYIIKMSQPVLWEGTGMVEQPGAVVPPSYSVAKGWNLIGFKTMDVNSDGQIIQADDTILVSEYLGTLDQGTIAYLRYFDRSDVAFKELDLGSSMLICHGYWLYITAAGEIVPPIA